MTPKSINELAMFHSLDEGRGAVDRLLSDSQSNLEAALKMAKKNKKMKPMVSDIQTAIEAIRNIN